MKQVTTATGELIRGQRENLGITQRAAAEAIGVSNVFLGRIELGKCGLPIKHVPSVTKVLKVTRDQIMVAIKHDLNVRIDKKVKK